MKYKKEIAKLAEDAFKNMPDAQVKTVLKESLSHHGKQASDEEVVKLFNKMQDISKEVEENERADKILGHLGIPCLNGLVESKDLVEILMDEKKLKELLSRINMKAFW